MSGPICSVSPSIVPIISGIELFVSESQRDHSCRVQLMPQQRLSSSKAYQNERQQRSGRLIGNFVISWPIVKKVRARHVDLDVIGRHLSKDRGG